VSTDTEPRNPDLTVAELDYLGGSAHLQGEGKLSDGRYFYFRARHSEASLWASDVPYMDAPLGTGRQIAIGLYGCDHDPHVWSYVEKTHWRPLLDLMVWTLGNTEAHHG